MWRMMNFANDVVAMGLLLVFIRVDVGEKDIAFFFLSYMLSVRKLFQSIILYSPLTNGISFLTHLFPFSISFLFLQVNQLHQKLVVLPCLTCHRAICLLQRCLCGCYSID